MLLWERRKARSFFLAFAGASSVAIRFMRYFFLLEYLKHLPTGGGTFVKAKVPKTIRARRAPIANVRVCWGVPRHGVRVDGVPDSRFAPAARLYSILSALDSARS